MIELNVNAEKCRHVFVFHRRRRQMMSVIKKTGKKSSLCMNKT